MNAPQPPQDDPPAVAGRYALAAKKVVSDAAKVATDAFDVINADPPGAYGPGDAIQSASRLAAIAATGAMSLARIALQVQPDKGALLVADNIASIISRGLKDVIGVAADAAQSMNSQNKIIDRQEWINSAIKLTSIAALRGAEIVETAVAGPGPYLDPIATYLIPINSAPVSRKLAVTKLVRTGDPDQDDIKSLVSFDPTTAELGPGKTTFTMVINTVGLPSSVYQGEVEAREADPAQPVTKVPIMITIPPQQQP